MEQSLRLQFKIELRNSSMEKKETFTQLVKEEISQIEFKNKEKMALLSGFVKVNGALSLHNKKKSIVLKTEISKVAKLIYNALKDLFNINPILRYSRKIKLNKNVIYYIIIEENVDYILETLELSDGVFSTFPKKLSHDKNLRFFIIGVFLASGSINSPQSSNYHLQLSIHEEDDAKKLLKLLNFYKQDNQMSFKMVEHRNKYLLYLKKADQIATFLSVICAQNSLFDFEQTRIEKDFVNSGNRLTNCDTANYQRMMAKSNKQIEDINYIKENSDLSILTPKEKALCELRLKYPESSFAELSKILLETYDISLSKSGVYHVFNSIHEKCESLKTK